MLYTSELLHYLLLMWVISYILLMPQLTMELGSIHFPPKLKLKYPQPFTSCQQHNGDFAPNLPGLQVQSMRKHPIISTDKKTTVGLH